MSGTVRTIIRLVLACGIGLLAGASINAGWDVAGCLGALIFCVFLLGVEQGLDNG